MLAAVFLAIGIALSQEPRPLSIEEALRIAAVASEQVELADAGVTRASGSVWTARSGYLPSVSASAGWQHTFASEYDEIFDVPGGGGGIDLPFGKPDAWRVDLSASQLLFGGGRVRAQAKIARAALASARMSVESERASAVLAAAEAYYDVVLAERLVQIAAATQAQAETALEHARLGAEVGRTAEFDVLRAGAEVEAQRVTVIQQRRGLEIARLRLGQLLDLEGPLDLTSSLETDVAETAAEVAGVGAAGEAGDRLAVRLGEQTVRMAEAGIVAARSSWFPQVSLAGSIGWVSYPDTVLPPVEPEQWRDNIGAGLQVSLPIFSGGRLWGGLLDARAGRHEARTRLEQARELAELDTADARSALASALAQWEAAGATVEQAERAYAIAEVRFAEGVSTQSELVDARLLQQQARASRARAARDLQVARIRIALLAALPAVPTP